MAVTPLIRPLQSDRKAPPPLRPRAAAVLPSMRSLGAIATLLVAGMAAALTLAARPAFAQPAPTDCPPLLRHSFNSLQTGERHSLCEYRGKVLLIVNTASFCGYTQQYEGLEALYRKHRDRGLVVLGFPANDFAQEPGSNKEIAEFCRTTYGIQFPLFEKASAGKLPANPLYAELIRRSGQAPQWNFHKYLVDRSGNRVQSFGSAIAPEQREFVRALESLLADKPAG